MHRSQMNYESEVQITLCAAAHAMHCAQGNPKTVNVLFGFNEEAREQSRQTSTLTVERGSAVEMNQSMG